MARFRFFLLFILGISLVRIIILLLTPEVNEQRTLLPLKTNAELSSLMITHNKNSFTLEQGMYRRDPSKILQYMSDLLSLSQSENITDTDAQFGFDASSFAILLKTKNNQEYNIIFGRENSYLESVYVSIPEIRHIQLISKADYKKLYQSEEYFLSKKIFSFPMENIQRVAFSLEGQEHLLQKKEDRWRIDERKADHVFSAGYLRDLASAELFEDLPDTIPERLTHFKKSTTSVQVFYYHDGQKREKNEPLTLGSPIFMDDKIIGYYALLSKRGDIFSISQKVKKRIFVEPQYFSVIQ